ncbi:MAG: phosphomannomutase [Gammaproteobacteria bacterium]|nr:phosphomannomutase [Gammaproteobacteria bacterium]MBU1654558.1 phosphomannomutase [Gammaproteobacteria bacterium]MBU1961950.1 phosphomannomutase [Gammaproteobacteria bacterium]
MNLDCFKAYDIRGRVPDELDGRTAWAIGCAFSEQINPGVAVVGHDARLESPVLAEAVMSGLMAGGSQVIDIGLCGTEEVYFQTFHRQSAGVGGGIMITASHNPKGYCGMKLVREGARPVSGDTGLFALRGRAKAILAQHASIEIQTGPGMTRDEDKANYIAHLLNYIDRSTLKPLKIVADPGNGTAGPIIHLLEKHLPFEFILLNGEPDGHFPNGVPNPLLPEMRTATAEAVKKHHADLGIAWDGDFDRCFLYDETGAFIEGYYIVGLLAETFLAKHPGEKIIHDPRLTWNTIDRVKRAGGIPIQSKTGHAFIKERMRQENAIYGGEMSAHHYFRDFAYCDSGMIPWLLVAELISRAGQPLSELVGERINTFPCSGEINFRVDEVTTTIDRVLAHYREGNPHEPPLVDNTDGLSLEFADWRFNLRGSNTEPLLRLNVESRRDPQAVARHVSEIEAIISTPIEQRRVDKRSASTGNTIPPPAQ